MKKQQFENILNECLERVLNSTATVEQCLAWYPDEAAELEPLLRTAMAAKDTAALTPRPEFRARARYQFQAALREVEAEKPRHRFNWHPAWAVAVATVVVVVLAGGGTVAAASNSLPDQPLYAVKMATETVQLSLTPSAQGKAELYLKFSDRRVAEMIAMAEQGKAAEVQSLARRLKQQLVAMAELNLPDGEEVVNATLSFGSMATTPETTVAAPTATVPAPATTLPPRPSVTVNTPQDRSKKGGQDKRAKMQAILQNSAVANEDALQNELDKAPPSVRNILHQALDDIIAGYNHTINRWGNGR